MPVKSTLVAFLAFVPAACSLIVDSNLKVLAADASDGTGEDSLPWDADADGEGPAPVCGDGVLDLVRDEQCDDGNTADGDGCSAACLLEPVGRSCGNSTRDAGEKCEDGNSINGDGCNPTCNLTTDVTTLATGVQGDALALDDTYLWIGACYPSSSPTLCEIQRIDIDACLRLGQCAASTVAGGACGRPFDGRGSGAVLSCVVSLATDGNTVWFGNTHTLRAMDTHTFDVVTLAGYPDSCAAIDGTGPSVYFHDIMGLTYYGGYLYFLDSCENVLRRYDPATGEVTTLAGTRVPDSGVTQSPPYTCPSTWNCTGSPIVDGQGLTAVFESPRYMTADYAGLLYIVDTNGEAIRSYDIGTGWVHTLVGGIGYVDGVGPAVRLSRPRGIAFDGTSLYFSEQAPSTVRQLVVGTLETSTLAGVRGCPGSRDGTGGDGTQDWSVPGCATIPPLPAQITTPFGDIVYHFPSGSLFLVEGDRLRRIE
jgi:cysteine-rich repeat protein